MPGNMVKRMIDLSNLSMMLLIFIIEIIVLQNTIKNKIASKIRFVNCVLVISGMYAQYSNWMIVEIEIALELDKPIIGIKPFGGQQIPRTVYTATDEAVGWNTSSIVDAIRKWSI